MGGAIPGTAFLAGRKVVCADDQIDPTAFELDGKPCEVHLLTPAGAGGLCE